MPSAGGPQLCGFYCKGLYALVTGRTRPRKQNDGSVGLDREAKQNAPGQVNPSQRQGFVKEIQGYMEILG